MIRQWTMQQRSAEGVSHYALGITVMNHFSTQYFERTLVIALLALFLPSVALAQWSAQPGETVRNAFGPLRGERASMCRGACGLACPSVCDEVVLFECLESERMRRVESFTCRTHQGCREHDDCLDSCRQNAESRDCETYCHTEAVNAYGIARASSWATGGGPFDDDPITFEYTLHAPNAHEPVYRCPGGARLECTGGKGRCVGVGGATTDPVFDSYPSAGAGAMRVSGFRSGRLCGDSVCEQASLIRVTGQDTCERGRCTRYGLEFDYQDADPSVPLVCSTETTGGGDFVGNILKKAAEAAPQLGDGSGKDGMAELLGLFQKVIKSADSPEDVQVSMAPLDADGNPIESQRVGTDVTDAPSVPRSIELPAASGHLVVPMFQLADIDNTKTRMREIRCTHNGLPVLEVAFQLEF